METPDTRPAASVLRPLTRWDFGEVHGVGESKLQQFAEVFLDEIRSFVQAESRVA